MPYPDVDFPLALPIMSDAAARRDGRMSLDEFLVWRQGREARHELVDGVPIEMAAERASHARIKARVWEALRDAVERAGVPCEAFTDGMTVPIDEHGASEPDALVHCGPPIDDDATVVPRPIVVVEVVSPSSVGRDSVAKVDGYFRMPGPRHYLIVSHDGRRVVHWSRTDDAGEPTVALVPPGPLALDPPGISVETERFFAPRAG